MRHQAKPANILAGRGFAALCALCVSGWAAAQPGTNLPAGQQRTPTEQAAHAERSITDWLMRMREASRDRSYIGTLVVSSNDGVMSSARVWHARESGQQVERIESLTGAPRSSVRRNDEVTTFLPERRVVRTEKREPMGLFPALVNASESSIPEFYTARRIGGDRVAGFATEVVELAPKDSLRFGYRVWSEKKTGLVLKLQTMDGDGKVLEQAAFSELQLDAPVRASKLGRMTAPPYGWRVEKAEALRTDAASEGWSIRSAVAGFKPVSCYLRPIAGAAASGATLQWIFSDGLAAVSLFLEPYDPQRHVQEGLFSSGATQTLTQRLQDWWLTAVGEVPPQTLKAFAQNLERRK